MTQPIVTRDTVFIAGGQPSITYVNRQQLDIERQLARAIAATNQIVSLSGPTKSGKTVLCRHVLGQRQYVWVEGGQTPTAKAVWDKICYELNYPATIAKNDSNSTTIQGEAKALILSASGSQLVSSGTTRTWTVDNMAQAVKHLIDNNIALIIDDFHYLDEDARKEVVRNIKGAVFNGMRVVLLSVAHRTFDVIKAETELTGRFVSVTVPEWTKDDLALIPQVGFKALNIACPATIIDKLCAECQNSPFIMQKLCWDICFDLGVDFPATKTMHVPTSIDLTALYVRIAKDSGLPIYERLVAGPQIRKNRMKRPLNGGGEVDVYQAILLAVAETGPVASLSYNDLRTALVNVLADKIPAKHEVTAVLKHLSIISRDIGTDVGVDWDDDKRQLDVSDPYLRFYLRWQVRQRAHAGVS